MFLMLVMIVKYWGKNNFTTKIIAIIEIGQPIINLRIEKYLLFIPKGIYR